MINIQGRGVGDLLPLFVALAYAGLLFAFASWAEGRGNARAKARLRPIAYALALAVYCTSWTFYGAVGSAVSEGWNYFAIYLGPILVFLLAHPFLTRLVEGVKADGARSISEFIGGRFGSSRGVAALVTLLALLGSIPYIALQLRSLATTYALITGKPGGLVAMAVAAASLAIFAMIYGTRRYEGAGRNDAVLFAVGVESLVKIAALTLVGIFAALALTGAGEAVTAQGFARLGAGFAPENIGMDFFVATMLSMAAILCLPRQFYVLVIEAGESRDVARARWPFILYLVATVLLVLPISAAGLGLLPADARPDLFVLHLPLSQGADIIALLAFLGGFSAATAMVLVETIALSTMVSNDLIAPTLLASRRFADEQDLGRMLLRVRRLCIGAIMVAGFAWAAGLETSQRLASIGLAAFAAMAQFAPILILAVYRTNRDALAAKAALCVGLLLWAYTLAFPQVAGDALLDRLSGTLIDPVALLGIDGLSPISHGTLWSLGANLVTFLLVTARRVQASQLPRLLRDASVESGSVSTLGELEAMVARFVGSDVAQEAFARFADDAPVERLHARLAERMIAGVVGLPSARALVGAALSGAALSHAEVARLLDDTGQSLRFSKGLLAATLEHIDPGVSVVDAELNLVAWNSRYLELFNYPPGMVRVGAPVADLIRYNAERGECGPGEVESHVARRMEHMRRGQVHSFERIRPDGRVIKTVGGPMPGGGYVMCFTDITAEAQAVSALQRARAELELRVDERTSALRAANVQLAAADAEKTRFLAAASHDLLQPLHAARLFSAALARDLEPRQKAMLDRLDRSIDSAEALLRALLDISKLDAGGITPSVAPVALRPMLSELLETMAPLAREKGLSLRFAAGDAMVETDAGLLRSIVQNFLSNAIRYTQEGGIIVGVRRRGSMARIDVIDTGAGIPPEKQEIIFREFERLPGASEGGIGLGLAIVERTARLLGARISLRSRPDRGSRFSVALPLVALALPEGSAAARQTSAAPALSAAPDLSVLVVDDDPVNCEAMASYIAGLGYRVTSATGNGEALACAAHQPFDVALVDFNLGDGEDGLMLIARLRDHQPDARYALVSAARPADYLERARAGGVALFAKPVVPEKLAIWIAEQAAR